MTSAPTEKQTMKASKPAMEKRRRARINESLLQLKSLVLDGLNKNNPRHSKLEKADILEMTVRYLRNVQRQQVKTSVDVDPAVLTKYRTGFAECMGEVSRYLGGAMDENPEVRARLLGHLAGLCTTQQQQRGQQPIKFAGGSHSQTQGTNHVQLSPTPVTSHGLEATVRPSPPIQVSSAQSPYANFPTPPPSRTHKVPVVGRQPVSTFLTSPKVEGARTGFTPRQAPITQDQQLPATPSSQSDTPVAKGANTQSVIVAQNLPTKASQQPPNFNEMITLVLPSQSLPGGQVPTHLIPVYAPQANAITSLPGVVTFHKPSPAATATAERSCDVSPSPVSTASPRMTSGAPSTATDGQQVAWTAIPIPAAQLISPRPGAVAPSILAPPLAISFPFNAEISPARLASHEKPREQIGRPIRLAGVYPNYEVSGDDDPMWRPW
ncbi:uncharacterized protein [Asterias amurensis]|uniref:uncharacterized protein isoform X1 n=2 Tax=Asterias amurensis TaxID=7602 RepID=UPI003AB5B76A